jgi:hypothetical protein
MNAIPNYNRGEESVSGIAAGQAEVCAGYRQAGHNVFVFFFFE